MTKQQSELDRARARIRRVGVNKMAQRSGIARRTLQYMMSGDMQTKYETVRKVLEAK